MNGKRLGFVMVIVILFSLVAGSAGVTARELPPPAPERPDALEGEVLAGNPYQPQRDAQGRWVVSGDRLLDPLPGALAVAASGGPDDFGYTWEDSVALNWIDASSGVNLDEYYFDYGGSIDMGFDFKFYENTYQYINVSQHGYLTFTPYTYNHQSEVPSPELPNDVIAPHWIPIDRIAGYVRYLKGGVAPNRWFVVEWNRVQNDVYDADYMDEFTFQAILHENGDIVFQYGIMDINNGYFCMASGIEDSTGLDGLRITNFCSPVAGNHAVYITRPAPAARVRIWPLYQGLFTQPGKLAAFQVPVRNTGELGADTYDILLNTTGWPVSVFAANGAALVDSDADGVVDTGPVAQGSTITVTVKVQSPNPVNVGDSHLAMLTATSSLDPTKSKTTDLQTVVPAPFAQAYMDDAVGSQNLFLAQPAGQDLKKLTTDRYYGWNGAVAEAPNGNLVNVWQKGRCLDQDCNVYVYELEYAILDHAGNVIRPAGKLTDLSGVANNIYDEIPAVAVAPDGKIGVFWRRVTYNSNWESNYNLHLAILDASGNPSTAQANLTNNTQWGYADGVPRYYDPRITATDDNRFAMAWYTYISTSTGSISDIYFAIRDTQSSPVAAVKFTNDTPGYDQYYRYPSLSALNNNRLLLAYSHYINYTDSVAYAVLDSSGNVIYPQSLISGYGFNLDAAQLSDGKVLLAWSSWTGFYPRLYYAILDGSTYILNASPQVLDNPSGVIGDDYVSVTADRAGRAILTWTDADYNYRPNLYYATIAGNGAVLTPPSIFRTAEQSGAGMQYLDVHVGGYANTSYTITPTTPQVDAYIKTAALAGAAPDGNVAISIQFGNLGATTATSLVITATLDSELTYVGNSLGITPTINGSELTWAIPTSLAFLGCGQFVLWVQAPQADYGTRYPVALEISSSGPEGVAGNNAANLHVMVARLVGLPLVMGR